MAKIYIRNKEEFKMKIIKLGLTQRELARRVGVGSTYVSAVINSKNPLGAVTAKKISDILEVEMEDIFTIEY